MRYNPVKDEYYTNLSDTIRPNERATVEGWSNGLLAIENVHRKVEHDWKMVCLFFLLFKKINTPAALILQLKFRGTWNFGIFSDFLKGVFN